MKERIREYRWEILFFAAEILLVGVLMLWGLMRDTWDYWSPAVHILTAGTLLNAFWYCAVTGRFFLPLQVSAAAVFVLFFLFGELPEGEYQTYFNRSRLWDALGMALAGASLAVSSSALGAIFGHSIRAVREKICTGRGEFPFLWESLLCFVWITVIYLFPLSVRFTKWGFLLDRDEFFFFVFLAACICTGVYRFVRGRFLLPVLILTLISAGAGFFTYSYPEVYTTAHLFDFAENVQIIGPLFFAPMTALAGCLGALIGRIASAAVRDSLEYRKKIQNYHKSE